MIARALLLAAGVIALPAHGAECYTWREAAAPVHPANTTPRPVRKAAKPVQVRRKGKRIKAPTTQDLPRLERVRTECEARPPVVELFLPEKMQPKEPRGRLPGFMPTRPLVPQRPAPEWLEGPLAVIPPGGFVHGPAAGGTVAPLPARPTPVPLPGTLALVLGGAAAWSAARRSSASSRRRERR